METQTSPGSAESTGASATAPAAIGRYQVLGLIGAGGMGMVLAAWDPELERRVALKLLRASSSTVSHERMLREGQLLAKLSHPNIVPVFDVGEVDAQIYLVMEYVRGITLREFAEEQPGWREVLGAYVQAGHGLAAAHAAGIIHRDFKPDNAIVGEDGRVRVLDFGIAHTESAESSSSGSAGPARGAGTPRYMAPEQADASATTALTAAVDQYAFCVALREALDKTGGVPAWVATILARGGAIDPAGRYPSFAELLVALGRDPARRWRRVGVGVGLVGAALAAFVVGQRSSDAAQVEPCSGGPAEIARTWNAGTRAGLLAHTGQLGARGASEGARLAGELDAYAAGWVAQHRASCLAQERKELSLERYTMQLGCLERTRAQLGAVSELVSSVDAAGLDNALVAARMMPDVAACGSVTDAVAPPPALTAGMVAAVVPEIERAAVLVAAERDEGTRMAEAAVVQARATSYAPVIARALMIRGRVASQSGAPEEAALAEAVQLALAAFDDVLAVEAYARWLFVKATHGTATVESLPTMQAIAERGGARGTFARGLLYNNLGITQFIQGDHERARASYLRALAEAENTPEIELAVAGQNLANLEPTAAASLARMQQTYERYRAALGPDHPRTRAIEMFVGAMTPDVAAARRAFGDCQQFEVDLREECAYDAAWVADEAGDGAAAVAMMRQVLDPESLATVIARAYVELKTTGSLSATTRAGLDRIAHGPLEPVYQRVYVADAWMLLALATEETSAWEAAARTIAPVDVGYARRRRARIAATYALRVARSHADEAATYAAIALDWFRAGGDQERVRALEALTARRGSN